MDKLNNEHLLRLINQVFNDSIPWRIVKVLAHDHYGLTLRELARRVGVAPKTLYKHIDRLEKAGVLEVHKPSPRIKLIKLTSKYLWVKDFLQVNPHSE